MHRSRAGIAALVLLAWPAAAAAQEAASDAELVTVTHHQITATWTTPEESDTTVCVDPRPCQKQEKSTRYHYAHVRGLNPGRTYTYRLLSGGELQPPSATNPGTFTTLRRPPGRHLFAFALLADTHLGEECSGTAVTAPVTGSVPPCFSTEPPDPEYAAAMTESAVGQVNRRGIGLTIMPADNTSHAEHEQAEHALRKFRKLAGKWHVARGSHDRAGQNEEDPKHCGKDNDCFREVFFPKREAGRIYFSFDYAGHHFIGLDSVGSDGQGDLTDDEQNAFLERDLDRALRKDLKTFIFFHHPVAEYANTTSVPPVVFGVRPDRGRDEFIDLIAEYPNVVGVLNAHTHRNYVAYSPKTGVDVPFIESGPVKEYPGGYSMFRVYEGGYTRNFHRLGCGFCRAWIATTRNEYFGLYPLYTIGTLSARNFTHVYDCDVPTPPPSPPGGNESATGGDTSSACEDAGTEVGAERSDPEDPTDDILPGEPPELPEEPELPPDIPELPSVGGELDALSPTR